MINKALLRLHLILSSCWKYSNNFNNKRNNASFSVHNITTKAILATAVNKLSGRCHIDFCNCLIHSELLNSVWISGQKIGGNPRFKKLVFDYQCVTERDVASSRLVEFVPSTVSYVFVRRKFQNFVEPLKVMVSCWRILRSRIGSQDLMISGNKA